MKNWRCATRTRRPIRHDPGAVSAPFDRVQVVTSNGTVVEITSAGDAIVAQLHRADQEVGFELPIYRTLQAFESAGASGPVKLGDRDDAAVIDAIQRTGGESHPDPGVANLHSTLVKELHARWAEADAQLVGNQVQAWFRERGLLMSLSGEGVDWWANLHRIDHSDWLANLDRINDAPVIPRYAHGASPEEAAIRARERWEQEQQYGDAACVRCHAEIAETYRRHPMGRSLFPIADAASLGADPGREHAQFDVNGSRYSVEHQGNRVIHQETRRDASGRVISKVEAEVAYTIGSGRQAFSYLIERDGFLFESPITWYAKDRRWGLSPGYERRVSPFERPILSECLFCHANRAERVTSALNRYRTPIFQGHAIGCERCHGPGELHVRRPEVVDGRDATIVNPADLASITPRCRLRAMPPDRPETDRPH